LLAAPVYWATVDYREIQGPAIGATVAATAERAGTAHGIALWFDTDLTDGVGFSNSPEEAPTIYKQAFLPLLEPVPVEAGDEFEMAIRADHVGGDYVWGWNTTVRSPGGEVKCRFRQSTFYGTPLASSMLRKRAADFVPSLAEDGAIDLFILRQFDLAGSLGDIAADVLARFNGRFSTWQSALDRVAALSAQYSADEGGTQLPDRAVP
jgi:protein arginine N-methyltransferase 1